MHNSELVLELPVSNRDFLRVYIYQYQDGIRVTISMENEDFTISSENLSPLFDPFTGKRLSNDDADSQKLVQGISLKRNNRKMLPNCCYLRDGVIHAQVADTVIRYQPKYNMLTGAAI